MGRAAADAANALSLSFSFSLSLSFFPLLPPNSLLLLLGDFCALEEEEGLEERESGGRGREGVRVRGEVVLDISLTTECSQSIQ